MTARLSRLLRLFKRLKPTRFGQTEYWASALLPGECLCCKDYLAPINHCLCNPCISDLPWLGNHCLRCAIPLESSCEDIICADCQRRPPAFRRCISAFEYQQPISHMIKRIKADAYAPQLRQLSELLAKRIKAAYSDQQRPDILIPVPLHWGQQLRRGFNQSQGIAQILARGLSNSQIYSRCLRRRAYSRPQHLQGKRQRLYSMHNAFEVRTAKPIEGRTVALIDDVITTGATANTAARALLAAGVYAVDIWCIARTGWHIDSA